MENMGEWEHSKLVNELTQGWELAMQLQVHLNVPSSSASSSSSSTSHYHQSREMLVQKIISSYEKALSMLNLSSSSAGEPQVPAAGLVIESPPSLSGSPRSEDSDRDGRDQEHRDGSKKRKTSPRWTQQVRISPGTGLEGPLDDSFSWRKYGQKDILGAKYPRGYYRCTHRHVQGCLATKQVQRSDEDPTIFEITYRGKHTCSQASKMNPPLTTQPENQDQANNSNNSNINIEPQQQFTYYHQTHHHQQQQQQQQQPEEALLNLRKGLKVVTEDLDIQHQQSFPPFHHFPSTSNTMNADQTKVFSSSSMANNTTNFLGSVSPSFISPATSRTNYFSSSPSGISSFQGNQCFQSPDQSGKLNHETLSAATSTTNTPTVGLALPFGNGEYDPNFTFDNLAFLSSFQPFEK